MRISLLGPNNGELLDELNTYHLELGPMRLSFRPCRHLVGFSCKEDGWV